MKQVGISNHFTLALLPLRGITPNRHTALSSYLKGRPLPEIADIQENRTDISINTT
jgi:hypothetical protein